MQPDSPTPSTYSASHRPLWLVLAVVLLAMLAWSSSLLVTQDVESSADTPTPTKTPAFDARQRAEEGASLTGVVRLPTFTPVPTATSIPAPSPTPVPSRLAADEEAAPERVVALARARGLNPQGRFIVVDQDQQLMYVVEEGRLLRQLDVTTGDPRYGWDTPAWFGVIGDYWGTFHGRGGVMADEGWWLFERGGNFLIHGLPYTLDEDGVKHYKDRDYLGALPASNGCIRLSPEDARWFTAWKPAGSPIIILPMSGAHEAGG